MRHFTFQSRSLGCGPLAPRMRQLLRILQLVLVLIASFAGGTRRMSAQHADQKPRESTGIDVQWSKLSAPASERWIAAEWSNSSKPLIGAVGATHVVVWDPSTQKAILSVPHGVRLIDHWFPHVRIRLSPDGRQVAVVFPDRGTVVRRWNIPDGAPLKEVPISGLSFADFTFLDAGNRVFVLGSDSRLFTYDLATGNRETKLLQHPARYDNAHLSVTGATILVDHRVGRDREVLMWEHDVGMWKQMAFYRDISSFDTFVVSARGDTFVGCFTDVKSPPWTYPITFRHPLADDRIVMGRGTLSPITNIAIAPHGCFFLLVTRDGQLTFWDAIANCAVVHTDLGLSPVRAAVSPDARHVTVLFPPAR